MALSPPFRGGPNIEFFESPESIMGFEKVLQWLNYFCKKHVQSCPPTKETLSRLLIAFIEFQETHLGKKSTEKSTKPPTMRLPMWCFLDLKLGGTVCHIFANMFRYKYEHNWKEFDFTQADSNIQMSKEIFERLMEHNFFILPTIFIRPEVDDDTRNRINDIVKSIQCVITTEQNDASHIIYPEIGYSTDAYALAYARPWFKSGQHIMLHWYYLPHSYNVWVQNTFDLPANVLNDISETIDLPLKSWRVSAEWVIQSYENNELMAEEDFEVNENGEKIIYRHQLKVEDIQSDKSSKKIAKKRPNEAICKAATTSTKVVTAECPECGQIFTAKEAKKVLARHIQARHAPESEKLKCPMCTYTTSRKNQLNDHQRRKHLEPVKLGRTKKTETPRKRSPFRKDVFNHRHKSSMDILERNTQLEQMVAKDKAEKLENEQRLEQRLKEMENKVENQIRKNAIEYGKVKTRVSIIESKQNEFELPDLNDIQALLNYFNLNDACTKADINKTINIRLMEVSSESTVSNEIWSKSNMTKEKRESLSTFYNKVSEKLLKWRKFTDLQAAKCIKIK